MPLLNRRNVPMYQRIVSVVVLALMIGSSVLAYGIVTGAARSDCPGKAASLQGGSKLLLDGRGV